MMRKTVACYSIFVGATVFVMWLRILSSRQVPEGRIELTFHLASEFIMAGICILSGVLLLRRAKYAKRINLLAHGMIVYSVLNAAGYYGERGNGMMMALFILLCVMTISAIMMNLRMSSSEKQS